MTITHRYTTTVRRTIEVNWAVGDMIVNSAFGWHYVVTRIFLGDDRVPMIETSIGLYANPERVVNSVAHWDDVVTDQRPRRGWKRLAGAGSTPTVLEYDEEVEQSFEHRWQVGDVISQWRGWKFEVRGVGMSNDGVGEPRPAYAIDGTAIRWGDSVEKWDNARYKLVGGPRFEEPYTGNLQVGDQWQFVWAQHLSGLSTFEVLATKRENGQNKVKIRKVGTPDWGPFWEYDKTDVVIVGGPRYTPPVEHAFKAGDIVRSKRYGGEYEIIETDKTMSHTYSYHLRRTSKAHRPHIWECGYFLPAAYELVFPTEPKGRYTVTVEVEHEHCANTNYTEFVGRTLRNAFREHNAKGGHVVVPFTVTDVTVEKVL